MLSDSLAHGCVGVVHPKEHETLGLTGQ